MSSGFGTVAAGGCCGNPKGGGEHKLRPCDPWGDSCQQGVGEAERKARPEDPNAEEVVVDSPHGGEVAAHIGRIQMCYMWDMSVGPEFQHGLRMWERYSPLEHSIPCGACWLGDPDCINILVSAWIGGLIFPCS